jgi:zeaxanthin glucosyltransferase
VSVRVLISSLQVSADASKGHLNPLIAVAQWLGRLGATTAWLPLPSPMGAADRAQVEGCGVPLLDTPPLPAGVLKEGAELGRLALDPARIWEAYRSFLLDPVDHLIGPVREILARWKPDVVVTDTMGYAMILACHAGGIPWVGVCAGLKLLAPGPFAGVYRGDFDPIVPRRAAAFARHGLTPEFRLFECASPYANAVFTTAELASGFAPPPHTHLVGPSIPPSARGDEPDFPWERLDGRPVVYLAFGSVHTYLDMDDVLGPVASAAAALGAQLVVSSAALARRGHDLGDHVLAVPYAPQLAVLERSAACVTHGGANTVMEALHHGVPLLVIPLSSDQPLQADIVERADVGRGIVREELTLGRCREALGEILDPQGAIRRRARAVAESYRAAPGARRVAELALEVADRR